jgi:hypothetical protein
MLEGLERHALMQPAGGGDTCPGELRIREMSVVLEAVEQRLDVGEGELEGVLEEVGIIGDAVVEDLIAVAVDDVAGDRLPAASDASGDGTQCAAVLAAAQPRLAFGITPLRAHRWTRCEPYQGPVRKFSFHDMEHAGNAT